LNRALDCHIARDGEQHVEMILHDNEFVQTKFALLAIVQDADEESCRSF
jgi:hypothetical protein